MMILILRNPLTVIREWLHKRLIASTPLISGSEDIRLDARLLRTIHFARRRCSMLGHIWEVEEMTTIGSNDSNHLYRFSLVCWRCFPHIQSRRVVESYNLFAGSSKETN